MPDLYVPGAHTQRFRKRDALFYRREGGTIVYIIQDLEVIRI